MEGGVSLLAVVIQAEEDGLPYGLAVAQASRIAAPLDQSAEEDTKDR